MAKSEKVTKCVLCGSEKQDYMYDGLRFCEKCLEKIRKMIGLK